ncbi:hypothetical protein [Aeromicrobium massiliense]|uniref:hypothetical protein n=1 Tax=Aeromicrobium massiliense TaxID=1464554 RepID=UPI0011CB25D6|nr:hypothetical protein [Aeromicrobium massiliense]
MTSDSATSNRIGVTGHQKLPRIAAELVEERLHEWYPDGLGITVVCSLAEGADSLVADILLCAGAELHAIIPSQGYRQTFDEQSVETYERLLGQASRVDVLDFREPSEEAYLSAGQLMVSTCETLIAVWDGEPSRGVGGTGDIVEFAASLGKSVRVIWPPGVAR